MDGRAKTTCGQSQPVLKTRVREKKKAYNDHSPDSQRRPESVRVQQPLRDKWKNSASNSAARPDDSESETFPGDKPLVDEVHGWEI